MLIQQDYILLIFNCEKYRYKALKQKETWLQEIPSYLKYYHVLSLQVSDRKSLTKSVGEISDYKFDDKNRVLRVNAPDDYNSLPKKVFAGYKAIHQTFSYKYIFKTDDDQMLNNPKFFDMIIGIINRVGSVHYGGHIVSVPKPHISNYWMIHPELPNNLVLQATKYCSGRFYLLSNEAVTYLLTKKEEICREYFEDYAIGYHLDAAQFKTPMLRINSDQFFSDIKFI